MTDEERQRIHAAAAYIGTDEYKRAQAANIRFATALAKQAIQENGTPEREAVAAVVRYVYDNSAYDDIFPRDLKDRIIESTVNDICGELEDNETGTANS